MIDFLKFGNGKVYLKLNGKRIGMIHLTDSGEISPYISHLHIYADYRNCGYGKILINSVIDRLKSNFKESVSLHVEIDNVLAIKFYRCLGFFISGVAQKTKKYKKHYLMTLRLK